MDQTQPPRRNVSGRPWKEVRVKTNPKQKTTGSSYDERMLKHRRAKLIKDHEHELKQVKLTQMEEKKQRRIQQNLNKQVNELRSQVVQSVSSRKVKRMSKKQLKTIEVRASGLIPAIKVKQDLEAKAYQAELLSKTLQA